MQQELNLGEYWHILIKRRTIIIVTFLCFVAFTALFTRAQVSVYETSALVRIDQYKSVMNVIADLLRWSPGEIMSTEVETAQGPNVLEEVAVRMGMLKKGASAEEKSRVISDLQTRIVAERVERTNMIRISATSSNPEQAARMANLTAEIYKDVSRDNSARDVRAARAFVETQLEKALTRLSESEDALRNFKESNGSLSVDSETQITLDRLTNFESELLGVRKSIEETRWEIRDLKERRQDLDIDREIGESSGGPVNTLYGMWLDVRQRIASQLNSETDNSRDVQDLRKEEKRVYGQLTGLISTGLNAKINELESRTSDFEKRENALSRLVGGELARIPDKDLELSRLTREVAMNEEIYQMLNREFKQAQIKEMGMASEVTIVSPAIEPRRPVKPNRGFNYAIGIMLGLILGIVMAALVESFDTSIGAIEDIERLLEVPVLAAVPRFDKSMQRSRFEFLRKNKKSAPLPLDRSRLLPAIFHPSSTAAEAYRHLRTNLQFSRLKEEKKAYLFTSSGPQEGKSTTVSNLAVVMAQSGMKTLLMSCNLRRPSVEKIFGIKRIPGLTDVLVGSVPLDEAIHTFADIVLGELEWEAALKLPGIDNLSILPAGTLPPNPAELLESRKMKDLIDSLRRDYDIIVIDAPPVLPVTDALLLGPNADGVILIYQLGHLPRRALIRAKKLLDGLHITVVGIVLNDVRPEFHGVTPVYYSRDYMSATKKALKAEEQADTGGDTSGED